MDHGQGRPEGMVGDGGRHGGMVSYGGRFKSELSATRRGFLRWGCIPGDGEINRVVGFSQVERFFTLSSFHKMHRVMECFKKNIVAM